MTASSSSGVCEGNVLYSIPSGLVPIGGNERSTRAISALTTSESELPCDVLYNCSFCWLRVYPKSLDEFVEFRCRVESSMLSGASPCCCTLVWLLTDFPAGFPVFLNESENNRTLTRGLESYRYQSGLPLKPALRDNWRFSPISLYHLVFCTTRIPQ